MHALLLLLHSIYSLSHRTHRSNGHYALSFINVLRAGECDAAKIERSFGAILRFVVFLCVLLMGSGSAWANDEEILLGMVEDVPGVYAGEGHSTKVRVLFSHQKNHWQAFKSDCMNSECLTDITSTFPKEVTWYIGLDGRQVGKVIAKTPTKFNFYAHIGFQDITEGNAPVVGKASYEFSGFDGRMVRRPLVAASKSNFQDPQQWKRYRSTPMVIKQALEIMRKHAPAVCKEGVDETERRIPFNYRQENLHVRAHKSNDGSLLLTISINGAFYCDGREGPDEYDEQMFAIEPAGEVRYLGSGLILVDAGDYDGDGVSELVMSFAGYNRGGYVLFSSKFIEEARFEFGYH